MGAFHKNKIMVLIWFYARIINELDKGETNAIWLLLAQTRR
jgi:hypothetical protein